MLCEKLKEQIAQLQELEELTEEQKALLEQLKNQYSQNCLNDTSYEDDDEDDNEDTFFWVSSNLDNSTDESAQDEGKSLWDQILELFGFWGNDGESQEKNEDNTESDDSKNNMLDDSSYDDSSYDDGWYDWGDSWDD